MTATTKAAVKSVKQMLTEEMNLPEFTPEAKNGRKVELYDIAALGEQYANNRYPQDFALCGYPETLFRLHVVRRTIHKNGRSDELTEFGKRVMEAFGYIKTKS